MRTVRTFVVVPSLPESLGDLKRIAYNLWWCWDHDAVDLFRRLDQELWHACGHNPVKMLGQFTQERLDEAACDEGFLAQLERVRKKMEAYLNSPRWYDSVDSSEMTRPIAYFSAEFGFHECLPIYSGGLGILAGDHLKSASDLGLPLTGVGLLYRQGFFQQYLNNDGWQQEAYPENDFYNMPLVLVMGEDGKPMRFHVDIGGHDVVVQVWRVEIGRVQLYLLDTNLRCNRIEDRQITAQLYGGDSEMRIRQEIVLGIGGLRALKVMGIEPTVCHINEGHAAFMALERIRVLMEEEDLSFSQAKEATQCGNVFTTHTPVPAGHDKFSPAMMEKYFGDYRKGLGLEWDAFLRLGRNRPGDSNDPFSMTVLALGLSAYRNGVSELHGKISRKMCEHLWPGVPTEEIPVQSITNGIHLRSWISRDMRELFDRYLGPGWSDQPGNRAMFERIDQVPDEEIWRTHERRRERLVLYARRHLREHLQRRGASPSEISSAEEVLDPEALTIGFARRFATYKRGTLLFEDIDRLAKILSDKDRPVQIIFAGKAHPKDTEGKELIRKIIHFSREEPFNRRIVFLENYNIDVARHLVQGVDVWLNTPRRGMEASGTSGMKVIVNGGINMSILDGWWCEGYQPDTGWAIGQGETYKDTEYQNEVESHALYHLLEKEVIPNFYTRGADRLPREWLRMMKQSMRKLSSQFSTARMVSEYAMKFYIPSALRCEQLRADSLKRAKTLADWKESLSDRWGEVAVLKVDMLSRGELQVGGELKVRCQVKLGSVDPGEVSVEMYQGFVDSQDQLTSGQAVPMELQGVANEDTYTFVGSLACQQSGRCGFAVRVVPRHPDMLNPYDPGLICWDEGDRRPAEQESVRKDEDSSNAECEVRNVE